MKGMSMCLMGVMICSVWGLQVLKLSRADPVCNLYVRQCNKRSTQLWNSTTSTLILLVGSTYSGCVPIDAITHHDRSWS